MSTGRADVIIRTRAQLQELRQAQSGFRQLFDTIKAGAALQVGFGITQGLTRAARAITQEFIPSFREVLSMGTRFDQQARRLRIGIENYQVLSRVLETNGVNARQLERAFAEMTGSILEAEAGIESKGRAFRDLNVEANDLRQLAPDEQFIRIAEAIGRAEDQQQAFAASMRILGRGPARELREVFELIGETDFETLSAEIRQRFGIIDQETASSLRRAEDRIAEIRSRLTVEFAEVIGNVFEGGADMFVLYLLRAAVRFNDLLLRGLLHAGNAFSVALITAVDLVRDAIANIFSSDRAEIQKEIAERERALQQLTRTFEQRASSGASERDLAAFSRSYLDPLENELVGLRQSLANTARGSGENLAESFRDGFLENFELLADDLDNHPVFGVLVRGSTGALKDFDAAIDELRETLGKVGPQTRGPFSGDSGIEPGAALRNQIALNEELVRQVQAERQIAAAREDQDAQVRLIGREQELVTELVRQYQELATALADTDELGAARAETRALTLQSQLELIGVGGGMAQGFLQQIQLADNLRRGIDGIGESFADAVTGVQSFGAAMANLARQVIRDLISMTTRALIFRAIMSLTPGFGAFLGLPALGFRGGGMVPGFASGGQIPGPPSTADNQLVRVSTGEYIVRAAAVQHWGKSFMDRINSMQGFAQGGMVGSGSAAMAGAGGGGDSQRIILVDNRRDAERLRGDPNFRNLVVEIGRQERNRI